METKICSEGFLLFCKTLEENISNLDEMIANIGKAMTYVADECSIGRMDMIISSPATSIDQKGVARSITMFIDSHGYKDKPNEDFFVGGDVGTMSIVTYPFPNHEFTEVELTAISFLAKVIYVFCGRAHLLGMIHKVSMTDVLTGLGNSDALTQFGGMLMATRALPNYAGMYINLKDFRYTNKKIGQRAADDVICGFARKMSSTVESDEIMVRLGGDNFVMVVKKEHVEDCLVNLSSMAVDVETPDGVVETVDVPSRVGIYMIDVNDTMGDVLNCSSIALNVAKASRKDNYVWFHPHMMERMMKEKAISSLFPKALQNMEFIVYYQPKVSLIDRSLSGAEALVRWLQDGKIVPPMEFVPLLEEEGSICNLDFYVLERVCQDIRSWIDTGIEPVRVSVNFSRMHLHNPHLSEDIMTILDKYDVETKYIEIELTEMSGYDDFDALQHFIEVMKVKGIFTSIDDFGTGYSSLNLLKELDVDVIKLDKTFVDHISEENGTDGLVVKNIIKLVKDLSMEVIAEGVETKEQADILKSINCNFVQGFLFDRPLEKGVFEKRLTNKIYDVE